MEKGTPKYCAVIKDFEVPPLHHRQSRARSRDKRKVQLWFLAAHEQYARSIKEVSYVYRFIHNDIYHTALSGNLCILLWALDKEGRFRPLARNGREAAPSHTQMACTLEQAGNSRW